MNEPRRLCQRATCCAASQLMMLWRIGHGDGLPHLLPDSALHCLCPAGWASAMFVAMLSLGEAIWSPRWYGELHGVCSWVITLFWAVP